MSEIKEKNEVLAEKSSARKMLPFAILNMVAAFVCLAAFGTVLFVSISNPNLKLFGYIGCPILIVLLFITLICSIINFNDINRNAKLPEALIRKYSDTDSLKIMTIKGEAKFINYKDMVSVSYTSKSEHYLLITYKDKENKHYSFKSGWCNDLSKINDFFQSVR